MNVSKKDQYKDLRDQIRSRITKYNSRGQGVVHTDAPANRPSWYIEKRQLEVCSSVVFPKFIVEHDHTWDVRESCTPTVKSEFRIVAAPVKLGRFRKRHDRLGF